MKWTTDQQNAIDLPVSDLIVSAAAGSGKTAVMAERIIKRITGDNGVDIDKILVCTYTSAAASEIKERIMKNIVDKLSDGSENSRLSNQLVKLPYAHISTIHGFCLDLIRKYFYLLGIDPSVRVCDETEAELMKASSVESVFLRCYEEKDEAFLSLIEDYTEKGDRAVREFVISVYDFSNTMPEPDMWLDKLTLPYENSDAKAEEYLLECTRTVGDVVISEYNSAIDLCSDNNECIVLKNFLIKERDTVLEALGKTSYGEMFEALSSMVFENWRSAKGEAEIKEKCKVKRDLAKKIITKTILEKYILYTDGNIKTDNKKVLPHIETIVGLVKEVRSVFEHQKKEKGVMDFCDFEHFALKLLKNPDGSPSDVAFSVSESFEEIYVDEFQDCNNIQNTIFSYISGAIRGKPNLFCVGDMKQSIYRFRDSNPLLFKEKCENFPLYEIGNVKSQNKILLNSNFRSRKQILDCVNSMFLQLMTTKCGELDYTEDEFLYYGSDYKDVNPDTKFVDIDIINTSGNESDTENNENLSATESEAIHVGNKIRHYIESGYLLHDKKNDIVRPVRYSDFVVLLRSPKTPGAVFEKIFSEMNIPVYSDRGSGYFESEEIKLILSLLKVIDNPDDDIALVSVMKSPVYGFDENKLLKIRLNARDVSFYECIKIYAKIKNDELADDIKFFLSKIDKYYVKSRYMDTAQFLCYLIDDTDLYAYLSIFPDGKLKKTNVRFLLRKAKEFEKNNFRGIYNFVRYIDNFKEKGDTGGAKILSESDDVVRIMSIHKSKGLEFPIVFVSGLGKKLNKKDLSKTTVLHKEFGIGMQCIYRQKGASFKSLNKLAIKMKLAYELMSEELRVLYVALTRATEKLILTSSLDNAHTKMREIEELSFRQGRTINPFHILSAQNYITIILLGISRSSAYPQLSDNTPLFEDDFSYNVSVIEQNNIILKKEPAMSDEWLKLFDAPTDNYEDVKKNLDYVYPYEKAFSLPTNMTVTELKRMTLENEDVYSPFDDVTLARPVSFGNSNKITGSSYGSLVHLIMEKITFCENMNEAQIRDELVRLFEENIITEDEKDSIDIPKLVKFFGSQTGIDMCKNSLRLKKEFSFKYLDNACEIFDHECDEQIIIQGTVDAFYEDEDGMLVIVDYKTDKVIDGDYDIIAKRYHSQLDYYAKALEKALSKHVKKKILYLFDIDKSIEV